METIYQKIADEFDRRQREAFASVTRCKVEDPRLTLFYKGQVSAFGQARVFMQALRDGRLPEGVTHGLEYWQAATDSKRREAADFVAFCQERIKVISDHYSEYGEYGTSRSRGMIEAYQAAINYAKGGDFFINCLGEIEDNKALDALFSQEGGDQ